jgi:hypothetical protein
MGDFMDRNKIEQGCGIAKAIIVISAIVMWFMASVYLHKGTDMNLYIIIGLQLIVGFFMIGYGFILLWITEKTKNWLTEKEKPAVKESKINKMKNKLAEKKLTKEVKTFANKMKSGGNESAPIKVEAKSTPPVDIKPQPAPKPALNPVKDELK